MFLLAITVDLMSLLLGLLVLAGIAALIGLTLMFVRLAQTLKQVSEIAEAAKPEVQQILSGITPAVTRVDNILGDVQKVSQAAGESLPQLVKSAGHAGETLTNTVGLLGESAYTAVSAVKGMIARGEKKLKAQKPAVDVQLIGEKFANKSNLTQIAGTAIGAYRFVQKFRKAKKKAERKKKFGF